jgi:hypothetical protein
MSLRKRFLNWLHSDTASDHRKRVSEESRRFQGGLAKEILECASAADLYRYEIDGTLADWRAQGFTGLTVTVALTAPCGPLLREARIVELLKSPATPAASVQAEASA